MTVETIDPLAGITGDGILECRRAYPDLSIREGDRLIVRQQATAEPGELVVALVDDCATVRPYEPGMRVLGVITGLTRSYA